MSIHENTKRAYWQSIRGVCIMAVVLIHSLGGFDYSVDHNTEFVVLRQIINFAVATFVFMAGYFVNIIKITDEKFNYKNWLICRGGRLCIPYIIWSTLYSGMTLFKQIHKGLEINGIGFVYRFIVGKSAAPFYYIVVLIQLTIITPWLVRVAKRNTALSKALYLVTPAYLIYIYTWNLITGTPPRLYETPFMAWFGFYYMGIRVRCGQKLECNGIVVIGAILVSCAEALVLRKLGMNLSFYTSQITVGSFLYSIAVVGWFLKKSEITYWKSKFLSRIGDCSYGIFYIHMMVLMVVSKFIDYDSWYVCWGLRFGLTILVSFCIVYVGQRLLYHHKQFTKYIGFV